MFDKFKKSKNLKYFLPVSLIIGVICVGLTIAYLSHTTETLTNKFTFGEVTTEIDEGNPGASNGVINKTPKVKNTGPNDCLVRMRVTFSPEEFRNLIEDTNDQISINFDTEHWHYNTTDKYWYYQGILKTSNITEALFTEVKGLTEIDTNGNTVVKDMYKELFNDIEITLYQESVQAIVYDSKGKYISAYNDDGTYNSADAMRIWELYDKELIDISTDSQNKN